MSIDELEKAIKEAQREATRLQGVLRKQKSALADTTLLLFAHDEGIEPAPKSSLRLRRTLRGHSGKITAMDWRADSRAIMSASQDGNILIWDPMSTKKIGAVILPSNWVMCCAYSPSGKYIASGGLENICSLYEVGVTSNGDEMRDIIRNPVNAMVGHTGFVSSCKFLSDNQITTGSGDGTIRIWDIENGLELSTFKGHLSEINGLALIKDCNTTSHVDDRLIISVGSDSSARIWDPRIKSDNACVRIYVGHAGDINQISVLPGMQIFATGGQDGTCRVFDLRSDRELSRLHCLPWMVQTAAEEAANLARSKGTLLGGLFGKGTNDDYSKVIFEKDDDDLVINALHGNENSSKENKSHAVISMDFSPSGRLLFCGCDGINRIIGWDLLTGQICSVIYCHDQNVSAIRTAPDGMSLATCSWDKFIKIWA